jgi:hypothetical protein
VQWVVRELDQRAVGQVDRRILALRGDRQPDRHASERRDTHAAVFLLVIAVVARGLDCPKPRERGTARKTPRRFLGAIRLGASLREEYACA